MKAQRHSVGRLLLLLSGVGITMASSFAGSWDPPAISAFRNPTATVDGTRFEDSIVALSRVHDSIGQELHNRGGFSSVFYPFGGVDLTPLRLGATVVLSGGLEPFGTPAELRSAVRFPDLLEHLSRTFARYTYLHVDQNQYFQRTTIGQDLLALAAHVFGMKVVEIRYFDDALKYAITPEQVEADAFRFRHARIDLEFEGKARIFYYVQSNMGSLPPQPYLSERNLTATPSPVFELLLKELRPDGMCIKADQYQRLSSELFRAFTRNSWPYVTYLGDDETELRTRYFATSKDLLDRAGPFGYHELTRATFLYTLRKATMQELEIERNKVKTLWGRWSDRMWHLWQRLPMGYLGRPPCEAAFQVQSHTLKKREPRPFPYRITM